MVRAVFQEIRYLAHIKVGVSISRNTIQNHQNKFKLILKKRHAVTEHHHPIKPSHGKCVDGQIPFCSKKASKKRVKGR